MKSNGKNIEKIIIEKAKELGATHYLLKPLDSKDWLEVVMEVADTVKERRQ